MPHVQALGQGNWRKIVKKVDSGRAGLRWRRGKRRLGVEVCEKRLEVKLRPYYNLVILSRIADEAYHTMPRPGGLAGASHFPTHGCVGDGRGRLPHCHANRSARDDAGAGTALIPRRLEGRVTPRLGFCLLAEPTGFPARSAAHTPS